MGFQIGASLLDACVLAVLDRRDVYGYELTVNIKSIIEISESTLYPILRRLEAQGAVTTHTRVVGGRLRKYFRITRVGVEKINDFTETMEQFQLISGYILRNRRRGYRR